MLLRRLSRADCGFGESASVAGMRFEFRRGSLGGSMILGARDEASDTVASSRALKHGGTGKASSGAMPESLDAVRRRSWRALMLGIE